MLLDDLMGTTPPELTQLVRDFCATLSDAEPEYVPVKPEGKAGYCYPNVKKKVETDGGDIVYGRMIWLGKALIEAEWHAVWLKDGRLVDVTAKTASEDRILFVRTNEVWDGKSVFPNIRHLLTDDPQIRQVISMLESQDRNARRLDDGRIWHNPTPDVQTLFGEAAAVPIPGRGSVGLAPVKYHAGRNDSCPCGSGKKFKKCCLRQHA